MEAGEDGGAAGGAPVGRRATAEFQGLFATDVQLMTGRVGYREERRELMWNVGLGWDEFLMDYLPSPFDFLGQAGDLAERRFSGQAGLRWRAGSRWWLLGTAGASAGIGDYRSAWLNEYYRQQYEPLPGYAAADPWGWNVGTGVRWEYLPGSGFLQADAGYRRDRIAPGYEIDFAGLHRMRDRLETGSVALSLEQAISRRVRGLFEVRFQDVTGREPRLMAQGSVNYAPGDRWVLRGFAGYTRESPQPFEAAFGGGSVEFRPAEGWEVGVTGRYYRDTGEIENSLPTAAAPGLTGWQAGTTVRRSWGAHALRLWVAPYLTRYEPFGIGTEPFRNLYRHRNWVLVQLAYAMEF